MLFTTQKFVFNKNLDIIVVCLSEAAPSWDRDHDSFTKLKAINFYTQGEDGVAISTVLMHGVLWNCIVK